MFLHKECMEQQQHILKIRLKTPQILLNKNTVCYESLSKTTLCVIKNKRLTLKEKNLVWVFFLIFLSEIEIQKNENLLTIEEEETCFGQRVLELRILSSEICDFELLYKCIINHPSLNRLYNSNRKIESIENLSVFLFRFQLLPVVTFVALRLRSENQKPKKPVSHEFYIPFDILPRSEGVLRACFNINIYFRNFKFET